MKVRLIPALLPLAIGGLLGYWLSIESGTKLSHLYAPFQESRPSTPVSALFDTAEVYEESIPNSLLAILQLDSKFAQKQAAYQLAAQASEEEIQDLIRASIRLDSTPQAVRMGRIFFSRYVTVNPTAALDFYFEVANPQNRYHQLLLQALLFEWAWLDPEAALQALQTLEPRNLRSTMTQRLAQEKELADHPNMIALIDSLPPREKMSAKMQVSIEQNPEKAFESVLAMSSGNRQSLYRLHDVVRQWAWKDPEAALERVMELNNLRDRGRLAQTVFSTWASNDPEKALALAISSDFKHLKMSGTVLSGVANNDGPRAIELMNQYSGELSPGTERAVLVGWAQYAPRAAAEYLEQEGLLENENIINQVANQYARRNPQEAYEWAQRVGLSDNTMKRITRAVATNSPEYAEQLMLALPHGQERAGFLSGLAQSKSRYNAKSATEWLNQFKGEPGYDKAYSNTVHQWIQQNPQEASVAVSDIVDAEQSRRAVNTLVHRWYQEDPTATEDWVYYQAEGNARDRALSALATLVATSAPSRAEAMIDSIDDEAVKASATNSVKRRAGR